MKILRPLLMLLVALLSAQILVLPAAAHQGPSAITCRIEARQGRYPAGCPRPTRDPNTTPDRRRDASPGAPRRPATPPRAIPQAPPPPPREQAVQTRSLVIGNECPYDLEVRLIYRAPDGYRQPSGEYWLVSTGTISAPLSHRGERLQLSTNEVYVHVTDPTGVWTWDQPYTGDYNGTSLQMGLANVSVNADGHYYIRFTCPDASPPPPPGGSGAAADGQTRPLVLRNECPYDIDVRLIYRASDGFRQPNAEYWTVASGTTPFHAPRPSISV